MKKLGVLTLVLVMLASIFALPAMAAEIQPRYPAYKCPLCDGGTEYRGNGYYYCRPCKYSFIAPG